MSEHYSRVAISGPPNKKQYAKKLLFCLSVKSLCSYTLDKVKELEIQTLIKDHFVFSAVTCISCLFVCFIIEIEKDGSVYIYGSVSKTLGMEMFERNVY